jgi:hypothetical protein
MESLVATTDSLGFATRESIRRGVDVGKLIILGVPDDERVLLDPAPIAQIRSIAARVSPST